PFLGDFLASICAIAHGRCRNSETQPLSWDTLRRERHFCRADADQSSRKIDHWPTAVTRVDCRIGLHQILVPNVVHSDVTLRGAKNASADGAAIANRIAHYDDCLPEQVR